MSIETLLREEIRSELEELSKLTLGTDEYETTVNGITKLIDRVVEMEKFKFEVEEKKESREVDYDLKLEQLRHEKRDQLFKNIISVGGIAVTSVITVWGTLKTFQFEEEGTVTTMIGRGFINKLLPKK